MRRIERICAHERRTRKKSQKEPRKKEIEREEDGEGRRARKETLAE